VSIVFGLCFALGIGTSDFLGGFATRRLPALTVVLGMLVGGVATAALLLAVVPSAFRIEDVGLGAASGLTVGFALMAMFHGLARSSPAVVSPLAALVSTLFPIGFDVLTGGELQGLVILGVVVGLVGIVLSSFSPDLGSAVNVGLLWGLIAGALFGSALTFLAGTSEASGVWPAVSQRTVALVLLFVVASQRNIPRFPAPGVRIVALASGLFGSLAVAAFAVGSQRGSITQVAVSGATFPAVTAALAAIFRLHPLRWWQVVGIGACIGGVALMALA
jgi:drug/metabolite transporter (DMT)-like permease